MPQGTIRSKSRRSVVTLSAKPCEVMPREMWTPMAAIFFSGIEPAGDGPDAGASGDALRWDGEVSQGADEGLLRAGGRSRLRRRGGFHGEAAEVEDGVADELAGAVVGDVSAAIDLVDLDSAIGEEFVAGEDVGAVESCVPG